MKVRTSFNIVADAAIGLSVCGYSAEVEMRRSEGEGEIERDGCRNLRNASPAVEVFGGPTLRREYPLPFGRSVILPLPDEALLMRLEVGDALPNLLALGLYPFHKGYPIPFVDGERHRWLDSKALRKRHRFFDERIKFSFPIGHGKSP
jgi:hypothetical protein